MAGPRPDNYREKIVGAGTLGETHETTLRRGDDRRYTFDRGLVHYESGTYKGERWHQNVNGLTIVDEPEPGESRRDPVTTTVKRVSAPVDAYVITALNVRGNGTREYVDPKTYLSVRVESLQTGHTVTTVYDRFARFGQQTLPTHWVVSASPEKSTMTYERTEFVTGAVTDGDLAEPPIRRALVDFPTGTTRANLPARIVDGRIYVRVTIGGRELDFLLDTGAASIAIEAGTAHALGLTFQNRARALNVGSFDTYEAVVPSLRVGALEMKDVVVSIIPDPLEERGGVKVVGLLGFDFLATLGVTIDYEHGRVSATTAGAYAPPHDSPVFVLDVRLSSQVPMTTAVFDGAVAERMILDTGFDGPFMLFDYFARRYPAVFSRRGRDQLFYGVGGSFRTTAYQMNELRLGQLRFKGFAGYRVSEAGAFPGATDGLIGVEFLHLFTIDLDYPEGQVFVIPNSYGRRALGLPPR